MALENCTLCQGTGWKVLPRKDGSAGKMAVPCDCGMEDRAKRIIERARIPKRYENCDFESFITDLSDERSYTPAAARNLKEAKFQAECFARDYPGSGEYGLLLMGNAGAGKTHLAIAILRELLQRGHSGYFCEYGKLLREIQNSYSASSEATEMAILEPVLNTEVLVIDDLGVIKPSDWVRDVIGFILNTRYSEASQDLSHRRCTIITTNYLDEPSEKTASGRDPRGRDTKIHEDMLKDRIGNRTRSRLYEMCRTVQFKVPDFRHEVRQPGRARA
jgi:DNA replication protein DnaC